MYDLAKDPHQLTNVAKTIDPKILLSMNHRLVELTICNGPTCKPGVKPYPPGHNWNSQYDVDDTKAKRTVLESFLSKDVPEHDGRNDAIPVKDTVLRYERPHGPHVSTKDETKSRTIL